MREDNRVTDLAKRLAATAGGDPDKLAQALEGEVVPGTGGSAAMLLVRIADEAGAEYFKSEDEQGYVSIPVGKGLATFRLDPKEDGRKGFSMWLRSRFLEEQDKTPPTNAMAEALRTLEAKALAKGVCRQIFQRVGEAEGNLYIDLGDDSFEVVRVTPTGWSVMESSPVRFYRARGAKPLPRPLGAGSIEDLRRLVNIKDDSDWVLLVSFLVGCFKPKGPYPILVLQGPHGSGKSTLSSLIGRLVDPNRADRLSIPRNEQDLFVVASQLHLLTFDNLSGMPAWLSDALCRMSTGGGYGVRSLYTNDDLAIFSVCRPVIINGIDDLAGRYDLQDRSIVIHLERINEDAARTNETLDSDVTAMAPRIFGAILDVLSHILATKDTVQPARLPRMADFALWLMAAEPAMGWKPGTFMRSLDANRREATEVAMDSDPVATAIREMIGKSKVWTGTVTDLMAELASRNPALSSDRSFPRSAKAMSNALQRLKTPLQQSGIEIARHLRRANGRILTISKPADANIDHHRHSSLDEPDAAAYQDSEPRQRMTDDGSDESARTWGAERQDDDRRGILFDDDTD